MTRARRRPPAVAHWLLTRLGRSDRAGNLADIDADLWELYEHRTATRGVTYARLRYYVDVISVLGRRRSRRQSPTRVSAWLGQGASQLVQDVRHGLRLFKRRPATLAMTVAGLALGTGVSTAAFTFLNITALRPYGMANPESLVVASRLHDGGQSSYWPPEAFRALGQPSLVTLEAWSARYPVPIRTGAGLESRATIGFVTGGYFRMLGSGVRGRVLDGRDDAPEAPLTIVLNHAFWKNVLGSDPAGVGSTIYVNDRPALVVGIIDAGFTGPTDYPPSVWAAFAARSTLLGTRRDLVVVQKGDAAGAIADPVRVIGRLATGASAAQAGAELEGLVAGLAGSGAVVAETMLKGVRLASADRPQMSPSLWLAVLAVGILVGLVLLLACANVTNLLLASALERRREIAVRLSLGSGRLRLMRQLLTESVMVSGIGAAIGFVLASWICPVVAALVDLDPAIDLSPDWRIYAFVAGIALVAGMAAGLPSARQGTAGDLISPLRGDGAQAGGALRGRRLRACLVGGQSAAALLLLVLASLFTRALVHASTLDLGYDPDRLIAVTAVFSAADDDTRVRQVLNDAAARIAALPGVQRLTLTSSPPFFGGAARARVERDGRSFFVDVVDAGADYFEVLGVALRRGRAFTEDDRRMRTPVTVISEDLAARLWPGEDPVGRVLERFGKDAENLRVIGVVPRTVNARMDEPSAGAVYRPIRDEREVCLLVRIDDRASDAAAVIRSTLRSLDSQRVYGVVTIRSRVDNALDDVQTLATLTLALGGVALALALVGVFGVTSFVVGQRTREISIRMAVGARANDVIVLLVREMIRPVAIGLTIGLAFALISTQLVARAMYGLSARDPLAFAAATLVLLVSAVLAVIVPTRRASKLDPALLLKE